MAGFEVSINGRIWVSTEGMYSRADSAFKNYHGGIELPPDDPEEFP